MKRAMIIAGGTGGHIFPALAVAEELRANNVFVCWLGARYGLEAKLVNGFPMEFVSVKGVRKKGLLAKVLAPFKILAATLKAYRVIKAKKVEVVLAMGGYVSAPGGLAAKLAGVPLVIHEQNARAGLTNRILAKFATTILQGFDHAFHASITAKTVGNPVRSVMLTLPQPEQRLLVRENLLRILVVGGSQGAQALNQCMLKLWAQFPDLKSVEVWHQTGEKDFAAVNEQYSQLPVKAKVEPFIHDMAKAYSFADVIICRAGAMTVSELAAVGAASILVPYPFAVDQHQHWNARYLSDQGGAILLDQKELSAEALIKILQKMLADKQYLLNMAQSAKKLAYKDAARCVAMECINVNKRSIADVR